MTCEVLICQRTSGWQSALTEYCRFKQKQLGNVGKNLPSYSMSAYVCWIRHRMVAVVHYARP